MSSRISLLMVVAAFLLSILMLTSADLPPRPTRPEKFNDKKEVKEYVEKLKEYYGVISRGRYGKRSEYGLPPQFVVRPYYPVPLPYMMRYGGYLDLPRLYE